MDISWRYPVIVQVVNRLGRDYWYGCVPSFGIEKFVEVDPGNAAQEVMFQRSLRKMISEYLLVFRTEKKEVPAIQKWSVMGDNSSPKGDQLASSDAEDLISVQEAAKTLGVHADTIRVLFDAGKLKGSLTTGGHRLISQKSITAEKAARVSRVENRRFEERAKKRKHGRTKKTVSFDRNF